MEKTNEKKQNIVPTEEENEQNFCPSWEDTTGPFPKLEDDGHLQERGA